jgi:hypothetical protein
MLTLCRFTRNFSFGMLLWEIAECKVPFSETKDFLEVSDIVAENRAKLTFGDTVPPEWKKATLQGFNLNYL